MVHTEQAMSSHALRRLMINVYLPKINGLSQWKELKRATNAIGFAIDFSLKSNSLGAQWLVTMGLP